MLGSDWRLLKRSEVLYEACPYCIYMGVSQLRGPRGYRDIGCIGFPKTRENPQPY